ncbi:MAG TPA: RDD family protein [Sphingomonadaceae bacterium]|nr:RDD family protein [Sphingomonadaceae bacterium]
MGEYGGFWRRVGAYLIDVILLGIVASTLGSIFGFGTTTSEFGDLSASYSYSVDDAESSLLSLALGIAYFAGLESSKMQATLGKKALGMVVTDLDGNRISFLRALGRYFAKILSALILLIGYIMVAFTVRKQGLHDMLAGTLVWKGDPHRTDPAIFD